jgi:Cep192 domain 4
MRDCLAGPSACAVTRSKKLSQITSLVLIGVASAWLCGCSGVVSGANSNSTPPPSSTAQLVVVPASVTFPGVVVGQKNTQTVQLSNAGSATLSIQTITITGAEFSATVPALPLSLAPGASQNLTVAFAPTAATSATGALTITSNDPKSPASIPLQGSGQSVSAQLVLSPTSINFGNTTVSTTNTKSATLQNTGNVSVTLTGVTVTGAGFGVSSLTSGLALSPQQQAPFQVWFQPSVVGTASGSLSITGRGLSAPVTMSLSGTGQSTTTTQHSVTLSWNSSTSPVSGYFVYRGSVSGGPYTQISSSLVPSLGYTDSSVTAGSTYYFVVTAVDSSGVQSVYSNQVSATIPTP